MRTLARALLACLAALTAGGALAAPPAPTPGALPRIVVAFANEQHAPPGPAGSSGSRYAGSGYAVGQSAQQQARRVASRYALHQVASWPIQALSMHCVVFEITDGRSVATVLEALSHDGSVVLAQPLQEFHSLTSGADARYNDPLYDLQTNLAVLGVPRAHERTQGAGVRVALIDTGVDAAHPDLTGRIARVRSFVPGPAPPAAALRHGTAMAGVIAAVANNHIGIVGVAPEVRIEVFAACWQLEAANDAAACNTFTLAQALAAALASGAPLVNLSIGGPADPLLAALVQSGLRARRSVRRRRRRDGRALPHRDSRGDHRQCQRTTGRTARARRARRARAHAAPERRVRLRLGHVGRGRGDHRRAGAADIGLAHPARRRRARRAAARQRRSRRRRRRCTAGRRGHRARPLEHAPGGFRVRRRAALNVSARA